MKRNIALRNALQGQNIYSPGQGPGFICECNSIATIVLIWNAVVVCDGRLKNLTLSIF